MNRSSMLIDTSHSFDTVSSDGDEEQEDLLFMGGGGGSAASSWWEHDTLVSEPNNNPRSVVSNPKVQTTTLAAVAVS